MRLIGLIPARGGSKGIPRKNIAPCGGVPLIVHTCRAAVAATSLSDVFVSTDDAEIASVAAREGVASPYTRPSELATDGATSLAVVQHFMEWLHARGDRADAVVLLQPTSPLRTSRHIDGAAAMFRDSGCDSLVSLVRIDHRYSPTAAMRIVNGRATFEDEQHGANRTRHDHEPVFARNGPAILITRADVVRRGSLYGRDIVAYLMPKLASIDIDDDDDLAIADALLRRGGESNRDRRDV